MLKKHLNIATLLLLMAGIEPRPPAQQATVLSTTPLHLGKYCVVGFQRNCRFLDLSTRPEKNKKLISRKGVKMFFGNQNWETWLDVWSLNFSPKREIKVQSILNMPG